MSDRADRELCELQGLCNEEYESSVKSSDLLWGRRLFYGVCGTGAALVAVTLPFLFPAFRRVCLPFIPATPTQLVNISAALKGRTGTLIDLGSGDGRIPVVAAKLGFQAAGVELNPWLVWYSKLSSVRHRVWRTAKFYHKDIMKTDLSKYDNIVVFGVPELMTPLEGKLATEMAKDSLVVACRFPLRNWESYEEIGEGIDTVWLYKKPSASQG